MTGIVVDVFNDEIFVFADGRCTDDDVIFTDDDLKIHKLDANNIVTMTGDDQIIDPTIELIKADAVTLENLRLINGDGNVIWVTKDKLTVLNFDPKETDTGIINRPGISSYKIDSGPFFFGSGTAHLQGAYYGLLPRRSHAREEYLELMVNTYDAAAKRITSMGTLRQIESILRTKTRKARGPKNES